MAAQAESGDLRTSYRFDRGHRLGGGYLSPAGHVLHVNIPKNASTSFQRLLLPNGFRYTTAYRVRPVPEDVTVFAVVREPFARWKSALLEYGRRPEQRLPFDQFVEQQLALLHSGAYEPLDEHLTPQSTFLLPTMPVQRWLRFEHLDADYGALAAEFGLPPQVRHHHRGPSREGALLAARLGEADRAAVLGHYAADARLHERVGSLLG